MKFVKPENWKSYEIYTLIGIYLIILANVIIFNDSFIAGLSAFFGITYTFLAGKGSPKCYIFGVSGSGLYSWLSFSNHFWGNLILYMCYYIPMQITGFFKWNKNLKANKSEIIKTKMSKKETLILYSTTILLSILVIIILKITSSKNPYIDGITTVFSVTGMYLTVKRSIEQWVIWMIVNGLSAIMWAELAFAGEKVYSTVLMWTVYFCLSVYFYFEWKKEINNN